MQAQLQLPLHHTTLHNATLQYTTQHYTTQCYTTVHNTTLHYSTSITSHNNYNCNYATLITLHYNYNSTILQLQLRYTTLHPAVVGEVTIATIATTPKKQLQPPFGPSVDSLRHPCITTTHLSYSVLSLKLPPPPCAVLLLKAYKTYKTFWHETDQSRIHGPKYGTALKTTNTMLVRWTVATIPGPRWTKAKGLWVAQDVNRMCF